MGMLNLTGHGDAAGQALLEHPLLVLAREVVVGREIPQPRRLPPRLDVLGHRQEADLSRDRQDLGVRRKNLPAPVVSPCARWGGRRSIGRITWQGERPDDCRYREKATVCSVHEESLARETRHEVARRFPLGGDAGLGVRGPAKLRVPQAVRKHGGHRVLVRLDVVRQ